MANAPVFVACPHCGADLMIGVEICTMPNKTIIWCTKMLLSDSESGDGCYQEFVLEVVFQPEVKIFTFVEVDDG